MTAALLALLAGYGAFLAYTGARLGWKGLGPSPRPGALTGAGLSGADLLREHTGDWLAQAGLSEVSAPELLAAMGAVAVAGGAATFALFGGWAVAVAGGVLATAAPLVVLRQRRRARHEVAQEAWPRMIEEIRVLTSSAGRSIPQALFEVGERAGPELGPAFEAAHREWLISTDLARATEVLKARLADPTADAACETLLVAHQLGGADLAARLEDLAADRRADLAHRRDARAQQAGARFARRFVLVVPLGMAAAGLSVGTGRDAYSTPQGQLAVAIGLAVMAACWVWAGRIMALPDEERVLR